MTSHILAAVSVSGAKFWNDTDLLWLFGGVIAGFIIRGRWGGG